jgi:hypothetical protein
VLILLVEFLDAQRTVISKFIFNFRVRVAAFTEVMTTFISDWLMARKPADRALVTYDVFHWFNSQLFLYFLSLSQRFR